MALTRDADPTTPRRLESPAVRPAVGDRRLAAAESTDSGALADMARSDPDPWVRANALRSNPDPALLRERLVAEPDPTVRALIRRLMEESR
jgi:hypothetical protein